jgi:hypothetical protein
VLCSNLDRILFSSSICLLWFDSDYRKGKKRTINAFDCFFAFLSKQCLLMVGLPAVSHFIFICSALDYGVLEVPLFFVYVYET